jgi:hypothetical protein
MAMGGQGKGADPALARTETHAPKWREGGGTGDGARGARYAVQSRPGLASEPANCHGPGPKSQIAGAPDG